MQKKKKKKKTLIGFEIFYIFFPDISVHCALIEYAYI
jgi:hypothetical protein